MDRADGKLGAPPYRYPGPATYVSHTGQKPMPIHWRPEYEPPLDVFNAWRTLAG